ncbi:MAG: hypothetical protein ACTH6O_14190 [Vibrio toranzoniae]|uniref:DNA-binding protein n=1 Tax=Vibrio TaxID=662 RepID=UPI0013773D37|nr:DNA-binding protein [Vibrio toranzoniae]NAZ98667.1 DNA-binding protein [Vibrio toranzoniae]
MNKSDLENLVEIRVSEAQALLNSGNFQGAYYLVGYSLECAFKVCIAKQVQQYDFPNKQLATKSHTHKLTDLLGVAGLKQKLTEKENSDLDFKLNWAVAKDWSEASRYECIIEESKAVDLFNAINEPQSGILAWLKTFW